MLFELHIFWVTVTLVCFFVSSTLYAKYKTPLLNPVFIAVSLLIIIIKVSSARIDQYNESVRIINFFLGPSVVALGHLLHKQWEEIAKNIKAILCSIGAASLIGIFSVAIIAHMLGASSELLATLAPKSVTTPIAIGISLKTGGIPSLTAAVVIAVGIFGAIIGSWFLNLTKIKHPFARGLAFGSASHGIGTARAVEEGEVAGTAAALAIGLMGIFTVSYIYLMYVLIGHWQKIQEVMNKILFF